MMSSKVIVFGLVCFGLGYGVALINIDDKSAHLSSVSSDKRVIADLNTTSKNIVSQQLLDFSSSKNHVIPTENIAHIRSFLNALPEKELDYYLSKAFPLNDLTKIQDKKKFSERLLEELSTSSKNYENNLPGEIVVSRNLANNTQPENMNQIYKNQKITAHYDTFGKVTQTNQVFVKWTNQNTGEVLLFSPQKINENSNQNWVSYAPSEGWKPGTYAIEYYEMNDQLTPIAQTSYTINQVLK
ncbi:hypothetical protein ACIF8R_01340 [Acinetobacter sp. ABJ_C4_1]|uniref:hypothetical protein n=1 Tax=Acinetobacter sp. ABJ_C4_1 TaxID=3377080 RepID=UPI0037CBA71C